MRISFSIIVVALSLASCKEHKTNKITSSGFKSFTPYPIALADDRSMMVVATNDSIAAFDMDSGSMKWKIKYEMNSTSKRSIVLNKNLYIISGNEMDCFDASTGTKLWNNFLKGKSYYTTTPMIKGDSMICISEDQKNNFFLEIVIVSKSKFLEPLSLNFAPEDRLRALNISGAEFFIIKENSGNRFLSLFDLESWK